MAQQTRQEIGELSALLIARRSMCNGVDVVAPVKAVEQLAKCRKDKTGIRCSVGLHEWIVLAC